MATMIVQSTHKTQTVEDALKRAAFNLRKFAMSDYDREQAAIIEALTITPAEPMSVKFIPETKDANTPPR